jgi:hypothetical protein
MHVYAFLFIYDYDFFYSNETLKKYAYFFFKKNDLIHSEARVKKN